MNPAMTPEEAMDRARLARLERREETRRRREEARQAAAERRQAQEEAQLEAEARAIWKASQQVDRRITRGCVYCGIKGDYREMVQSQPLRVTGPMCQPCRDTPGDLAEMVTRRLRRERPELLAGFRPEPNHGGQWVPVGEPLDYDVLAEPVLWTWAHRVLEARRRGKADPRPPKTPFGWLS